MAHENIEELLNIAIPHAQELLGKYGEFYPFGASLDQNGNSRFNAAYTGTEKPEPNDLIDLLRASFEKDICDKKIQTWLICKNAVVTNSEKERRDAIVLEMCDANGERVELYMCYEKIADKFVYSDLERVR
jgi:hypothetical protein